MWRTCSGVAVYVSVVSLYVKHMSKAAAERCTPFEGNTSIIQCFHIKHPSSPVRVPSTCCMIVSTGHIHWDGSSASCVWNPFIIGITLGKRCKLRFLIESALILNSELYIWSLTLKINRQIKQVKCRYDRTFPNYKNSNEYLKSCCEIDTIEVKPSICSSSSGAALFSLPRWFESQSPAGESEAQRDAGRQSDDTARFK